MVQFSPTIIVGVGRDGELAVTWKAGKHLAITNFSLVQPENSVVGERARYDTATKMLTAVEKVSVDSMRSLLSAVHVEGLAATLYSTIYDLRSQEMYIYNFHDYEYVKKMGLHAELRKGAHSIPLVLLFKERDLFSLRSMKELAANVNSLQIKYLKTKENLDACGKIMP